jgi:hypothetical protein
VGVALTSEIGATPTPSPSPQGGGGAKPWMLAFGKHDGVRWREPTTTVIPALRAGIHGLLEHHGASPKSWMLVSGQG